MRHGDGLRKLGRPSAQRLALLRNLASQLIKHERLRTTLPKAKELRRVADKMVTLAKRDTLHTRRQARAYLYDEAVVAKLFYELGRRFADRQGGYTRVLRDGFRRGDAAPMAVIEYLPDGYVKREKIITRAEAQLHPKRRSHLKRRPGNMSLTDALEE